MYILTLQQKLKPRKQLTFFLILLLTFSVNLHASTDVSVEDEDESKGVFINDSEGSTEDEETPEPEKPVEEVKSPPVVETEDSLLKKKSGNSLG